MMALMSFINKIPGYRSRTPWKMVVATLFYLLIISSFFPHRHENSATHNNTSPTVTKQVQSEALEVVTYSLDYDSETSLTYATGEIKNNTAKTYKYVQVDINCYDDGGNQVKSLMANTNNLEAGGTWKFRKLIGSEPYVFKIMKVSGRQ